LPRRIFGPKRKEVAGGWRRVHNEEPYYLYCSPNIIRVITSRTMTWTEHVARLGEMRIEYKILAGKPEGKRPIGTSRHTWGNNVRMNLREMGWENVDWTQLAQDGYQWWALVNTVMNLRVP
jgi:hypothetical protein